MEFTHLILATSTLLCALVAGFLLAFTLVVMPGIKTMNDLAFLRSFKVMDGVIQNNQPGFMLIWVGSIVAIIASLVISFTHLDGTERLLVIMTAGIYLFGVQLPTITINVPLNNELQKTNLDILADSELAEARAKFEPRWIRWNTIRTMVSIGTSVLLIVVLLRI